MSKVHSTCTDEKIQREETLKKVFISFLDFEQKKNFRLLPENFGLNFEKHSTCPEEHLQRNIFRGTCWKLQIYWIMNKVLGTVDKHFFRVGKTTLSVPRKKLMKKLLEKKKNCNCFKILNEHFFVIFGEKVWPSCHICNLRILGSFWGKSFFSLESFVIFGVWAKKNTCQMCQKCILRAQMKKFERINFWKKVIFISFSDFEKKSDFYQEILAWTSKRILRVQINTYRAIFLKELVENFTFFWVLNEVSGTVAKNIFFRVAKTAISVPRNKLGKNIL